MLIGRESETIDLETAIGSDKSEFVAVYGRRRVGKTFLIREVCNYSFAFEHTGVKSAKWENQTQQNEYRLFDSVDIIFGYIIENHIQ